ncbi:ATP-dependent DNA helicase PcrA [Lysinibacillus contaminans]|uniref:DNA 3'-5' helicase n=1 Tax=Lysinibacillus contaminans TaxID=1293441 RepID=A0ABR5JZY6_9BACI|nr:UvrD-helicase domain-containing protein [Lysinibacillus contaminans]KOS68171.1 ATP-dependent DNA helicase PcrA [Lysinibacillus contaminans]
MFEKLLNALNEKQQQAVTATEGYIRIIAGAGSGKTKTLVNRYAYLVEALGISPKNILCVTFTNKAAAEMRKRVKSLLGNSNDGSLICTYHGFCVKVLREDIHHINYPKNFMILDEDDQKDILKEVYEELGLTIKFMKFDDVLKAIGFLKIGYDYVESLTNPLAKIEIPAETPMLSKVISLYLKKQRKYFALDFQDLINFVLYLYEQNTEVQLKWQNQLHYIQVDEFQDSSGKQIGLVNILSATHKNLFVVGDPDQAIYTWRGAKPAYLVNFHKTHEPCETIILNENYRSTPEILNLGNSIIKNNKVRIDKDLFTYNNNGVDVIHYHGKKEFEEIKYISETINSLVEKDGAKYSDFAIIYRANYNSRFVEQGFMRANIPYTMFSGFKFFQRAEIKDCIAYYKMVLYADDLSLLRTINNPKRSFGKTKINWLKQQAENDNLSYYETLLKYKEEPSFNKTKVKQFIDTIEKYKKLYSSLTISELLRGLLDDSGYDEELRLSGDQERIDNVSELLSSIITLEAEYGEKLELDDYLQQIALFSDNDREVNKNSVKLMTIHTAKGLEFPYVFLVSFNDGVLPSYRSLDKGNENGLEEERRLAYVAITRAMKAFYMTESEGLTNYGKRKFPSRFLFEIKQNLFTRLGVIEQELIDEAMEAFKQPSEEKEVISTEKFNVNDKILHSVFGEGIIKEINEDDNQYIIHFSEKDISRPLSMNFKGLTRV